MPWTLSWSTLEALRNAENRSTGIFVTRAGRAVGATLRVIDSESRTSNRSCWPGARWSPIARRGPSLTKTCRDRHRCD